MNFGMGLNQRGKVFWCKPGKLHQCAHMIETLSLHEGLGVGGLNAPSQHLPFKHSATTMSRWTSQVHPPSQTAAPINGFSPPKCWWICCSVLLPSHNKTEQSPNKQQANKSPVCFVLLWQNKFVSKSSAGVAHMLEKATRQTEKEARLVSLQWCL